MFSTRGLPAGRTRGAGPSFLRGEDTGPRRGPAWSQQQTKGLTASKGLRGHRLACYPDGCIETICIPQTGVGARRKGGPRGPLLAWHTQQLGEDPPSSRPECGQEVCWGEQGKLRPPTPGPPRGCRLSHPQTLEELRARVPQGSLSPGRSGRGVGCL